MTKCESSINSFINHWKKTRQQSVVFYGYSLNHTISTCGLTAVEATQCKEQRKHNTTNPRQQNNYHIPPKLVSPLTTLG